MENLKGNPDPVNNRESSPDPNKTITTNVVEKKSGKKSNMRLVSEDAKSVGSYVMIDIIIPKIKELITSGFKYAIDFIFYGSKGAKGTKPGIDTVSYSSYYTGSSYQQPSTGYSNPMAPKQNTIFTIGDIVFPDREDADKVLLALQESIIKYGTATVADFYDFINKAHSYTDNKYGWKDLRDAEIIRVDGGFSIRFPKVIPID